MIRRALTAAFLALLLAVPALGGVATTSAQLVSELATSVNGETIELGPGRFMAPKGGFIVRDQVTVRGSHPCRNRIQCGSVIIPFSPDDPGLVILNENTTVENVIVLGRSVYTMPETLNGVITLRPAMGHGIEIRRVGICSDVKFKNVMVWGAGADGIHVSLFGGSANALVLEDVVSARNGGHGLYVRSTHKGFIVRGYYHSNGLSGATLEDCSAWSIDDAAFDLNWTMGSTGDLQAGLVLNWGWGHQVDGCAFEQFGRIAIATRWCRGVRVVGCQFQGGERGVVLRDGSKVTIDACTWRGVKQRVDQPWGNTAWVREQVEIQ